MTIQCVCLDFFKFGLTESEFSYWGLFHWQHLNESGTRPFLCVFTQLHCPRRVSPCSSALSGVLSLQRPHLFPSSSYHLASSIPGLPETNQASPEPPAHVRGHCHCPSLVPLSHPLAFLTDMMASARHPSGCRGTVGIKEDTQPLQ
jgi:hypothetical protein